MSEGEGPQGPQQEGDEFRVPPLGAMMAYRGVWALSELNPKTGWLRATHYATCLIGGPQPMWGVWSVNGVFQRFFGAKSQIVEAYPRKAWRLRSATWNLIDIHKMDAAEKRTQMREIYHRGVLLDSGAPVAVVFEDGTILPWSKRTQHAGDYRPLYAGAVVPHDNVVHLAARRSAAV